MRAAAAVLLALFLATAAAGCGSKQDNGNYVKALNHAQTGLAQRFSELQARITPTSSAKQDQKTLSAYEGAVRKAVTELEAVDPPSGLAPLHRRFVAQIGDYSAALRTARGELRG